MKHPALLQTNHAVSRVLHAYADLRIGATEAEKRCHKRSDSILLTFDDSGSRQEIEAILTILKVKKVKAMMFIIGGWAGQNSDLVRLMEQSGHIVGNHTFSHPNLLKLSDSEVRNEIRKGTAGRWLRAPQGKASRRIRRIAESLGYSLCYWTIDSRDWSGMDEETMRHTILTELHPGAVILFHLNGKHTRELLPGLIDDIRAKGYQLTGMDESW